MTSSLPPTAPLEILQADPAGNITFEERVSQPACNREGCRAQPPALWFAEIPTHPHCVFPLKTVMAEQKLWSWSQDTSPPFPQTAGFSDYSNFPFYRRLPLELLAFEGWAADLEFSNREERTHHIGAHGALAGSHESWCLSLVLSLT